ncbi:aldehyde dehydrogenase [Metarhizium album ARSEF 1941]|uniref:Aldehyde dehydrogenase n=1 Tax=Metarhizium album (strain ARSEF 1941) TaxID=1081103 RepID=A0A0B2X6A7_METAS|nr:aldehyde dehydrogenase [Metarhizium album ARSEF 1941]KHO01263.1 aldehyde dehydrogenase [Metarhizium album ARSEF 1941]
MEPALVQELTTPNGHVYSQPLGLFIDNEFVRASTAAPITAIDPATEIEIASVQSAAAEDVDRAVQCARRALRSDAWSKVPGSERGRLLAKLAELMEEDKALLASVVSWENGLPYTSAAGEDVAGAIETVRYYGGWADKVGGRTVTPSPQKLAYTLREPVGVVGQIVPWNSPLMMAGWKLGPALACGNTVVLKAAEQTPLSILLLARLVRRAGFPPGVVNLINGRGGEAGAALVRHPLVDKIAFTGSTGTARSIMSLAAGTLKKITLETGGKSPLLVFPDADMDQAVKWAHLGAMAYSGQICTSTSRILVHRDAYDLFVARFQQAVRERSVVGPQWDGDTFQGPQVSKAQLDRVLGYIERGKQEGATLLMGGSACPIDGKGYYVQPTVFVDVAPSMAIYREEIFGPVAVICPFDDEDDAIAKANDSSYGLGASVFTRDVQRAHRVTAEIEAGTVWINSSQDCDFRIPFGGLKQSGIGRELGEEGLEAYTQVKAVHINMGTRL